MKKLSPLSLSMGILGFLFFFGLRFLTSNWGVWGYSQSSLWIALPLIISLYLAILFFAHYFFYAFPKFWHEYVLGAALTLSFSAFLSVTEDTLLLLGFYVGSAIVFATLFNHMGEDLPLHHYKPRRRMLMMFWVLSCFGFSSLFFASITFFQGMSFWIYSLILALYFSFSFIFIWKLYFVQSAQFFLFWALLSALLIWEFLWVLHILPFGYFVSAFFVVWLAYILQLFIRFELSEKGILWKRQRSFLLGNLALFIFILFIFIRWV